jgi:hypothetical protein
MWDEQKRQRYEDLRKREAELTLAERAALAALERECAGVESFSMAGVASVLFGAVAALGAVWLFFGISPGFVAQHPGEAGWDRLVNHATYFGPFVIMSWMVFLFAPQKNRFLLWMSC